MTQPTPGPQPPPVRDPADPGTQEIPVAPAGAAATGIQQLPRVDADLTPDGVEPTGPVDFVPGLPGLGAPPPPSPAQTAQTADAADTAQAAKSAPEATPAAGPEGTPGERGALVGAGLAALGLVLLELGLTPGFGDRPLWTAMPLWSVFATLAALLGLLPFAGRFLSVARRRPDGVWKVGAGGLTGLAVFWVLVVLLRADTDRGFVLTAALAALGAALWVAPARQS